MGEELKFGPNGAVRPIVEPIRQEFRTQRYKMYGPIIHFPFLGSLLWSPGKLGFSDLLTLQIVLSLAFLALAVASIIRIL